MSQNGGVPYHLNSSLRESPIPAIWKGAILVPKPKVNHVTNPTKVLRPIFLTHILAKLWKTILSNPKFNTNQFGALSGISITHARSCMICTRPHMAVKLLFRCCKDFHHIDSSKLLDKIENISVHLCI